MDLAEELRRALDRIAVLERDAEILREVVHTQDLLSATSFEPQRAIDLVARRTMELVAARAVIVELRDGDEMVYRAVSGAAADHLGSRQSIGESLSGSCLATSELLICRDSETEPRADRSARSLGMRSMIVTPLVDAGDSEGVLEAISDRPDAFGDRDIEVLRAMAGFVATALRNAGDFALSKSAKRHDPLTGLLNRASLLKGLGEKLERETVSNLAVLFIDLNGFETVNHGYGTRTGDRVLVRIGERLASCLRSDDLLGRVGGDDFVILLDGAVDAAVSAVRQRLHRALTAPILVGAHEIHIGATIGLALVGPADTALALLERAEADMRREKGRRVTGFDALGA